VGQATATGAIVLQLTDRYGVPVPNAPVRFNVTAGGGSLRPLNIATDIYGFGGAYVTLGPAPGTNTFAATAGGLATTFTAIARLQPTIKPNGVVSAATFTSSGTVAPGSYIAIFGTGLAETTQVESTPYLPVSIDNVSVSFDTASQSAPGHLHLVTPGQVNVQVPWEMQGQSSAQMKVSLQDSSGSLYTVPLAAYAPGMFEIPVGSATFAAARDENFNLITPSNPARQGHFIQLYCNGLGPVTNQPASGDPAPAGPLLRNHFHPCCHHWRPERKSALQWPHANRRGSLSVECDSPDRRHRHGAGHGQHWRRYQQAFQHRDPVNILAGTMRFCLPLLFMCLTALAADPLIELAQRHPAPQAMETAIAANLKDADPVKGTVVADGGNIFVAAIFPGVPNS